MSPPLLYRLVDPLEAWAARRPRLWQWLTARSRRPSSALSTPVASHEETLEVGHRAVVVGYGPVGRTLARLLRDNDIQATIIEMNLETVERLRKEGIHAVYGEASHGDTLKKAGVDRAGSLILSASNIRASEEIIRQARELNPRIRILVRSAYLREGPALRRAGADHVLSGEGEVALAMTEAVLRELGATPEQIDRERERLRADLFGAPPAPQPTEAPAEPAAEAPPPSSQDASGPSQT